MGIEDINVDEDCWSCGVPLTQAELDSGEGMCFPCLKGNNNDEDTD